MSRGDYYEGVSLRYLLFHPAVWLIVATAGMIFGATHLWATHRYKIANPSLYTISRDNVTINEPPTWFSNDLYDELYNHVFNSSTLLDQHVVPTTANYLSSIPWIQKVKNVNKNPNGLNIELNYRNPIAYVGNIDRPRTIVDSQGVVFDSRLLTALDSSRFENDLLRISMPRVDISRLQPWQTSADERVEHAASLCGLISHRASDLKLYRVVTFDLPSAEKKSGPELEIWTRGGVKVLWGRSPISESGGEATQNDKLQAIRAFVEHHGPLESFAGKGQQMIDVRSGIAQLIELRRYADSDFIRESLK